jgi:hypothetical protein
MSKDVTLRLDQFGKLALEGFARRSSCSPDATVKTASLYYLADRESGRTAWPVPRFAEEPRQIPGLRVSLDDATWTAVAEEAERQGVTAETLAVHAVLYFLADLGGGRLAEVLQQVLEDLE